jgi:hypothetical protein
MSNQSNNNESENRTNPTYNDMINPSSWSVEPEGLIDLINNMTINTTTIQNDSNVEDLSGNTPFSEILSDVDSNESIDESVDSRDLPALQELETIFQDFDIQEDADIQEDTVFQGIHIEIPSVQNEENGGAAAPVEEDVLPLDDDGLPIIPPSDIVVALQELDEEEGEENEVEEGEENEVEEGEENEVEEGEENSEVETQEVHPVNNVVDPVEEEELSDSDVSEINAYPIIDDCCVCYKPCTGENIVNTPCGHIYCSACFFRWIRVRPTCPMCRRDFTSIAAMSNDEIREDVHNITQLYRRTIIENDKLMYDNRILERKIKKKEKKNKDLDVESSSLITRLVSAREQLDYTKGYHNAIKDKARMELVKKLNIEVRPNNYLYECNQPPYNNIPFNRGYKLGIYEFDYCMDGFTNYQDKKSEYFIPKWKKKGGRNYVRGKKTYDKKVVATPQENEQ